LYSDAAKRCAEAVNLHIEANRADIFAVIGKWIAVKLEDGRSDGNLYDRKADAVRHQPDEFACCYIRLPMTRMSLKEAEIFLQFNRNLHAAGARMPDPEMNIDVPQETRLTDVLYLPKGARR
jgi:hypothetical protein